MPGKTRFAGKTAGSTGTMTSPSLFCGALCSALVLAACQATYAPEAPGRADLSAELLRRAESGPPPGPEGSCWASDETPAVIETVTEQVLVKAASFATDGSVLTPASFRTVTQQKIIKDREAVWFRTPCPAAMSVDFIATLQRALKARGLYRQPLTGVLDGPTRAAIRQFQAPLGLDSPLLSLAAARDLGIIAADLGQQ
ncbi:MAG: peptidoglycan-binding domain-containing protein [Pseudorhodobacter sp.]|nr:peptidoglycan-binding domain-containing protein [Pseudorhodobacter sp.]